VPALAGSAVRVARGRALVRLLCRGDAACVGRAALVRRSAGGRAAGGRRVRYGAARYAVAAGTRETVRITLNRRGRSLLRRSGRRAVRLALELTPQGGGPVTRRRVTLRAAR